MIFFLLLLAITTTSLLVVEWYDSRLDDRYPSYERGWAHVFGEKTPQRSHVTLAHRPCRSCHREGEHDPGCSWLDRLDAGEVTP